MTENINLDSTNLSIPEDAFDQFQRNSMYEEEEFITLSDIVSPEPTALHLPSDISDIPYDNEVVLSANDHPVADDLAGLATTITDSTDFTDVSAGESNANIVQAAEQIPDQNNEGRPKRDRKKKSYVDNLYETYDVKADTKVRGNKKGARSTPSTTKKGSRKSKNVAQNETVQPESFDHIDSTKQTPKTLKMGRKSLSEQFTTSNLNDDSANNQKALCESVSEPLSQDLINEFPTMKSTKSSGHKQASRRKKNPTILHNSGSKTSGTGHGKNAPRRRGKPKKTLLGPNTSEQSLNPENNLSGELVSDMSLAESMSRHAVTKKGKGRRGKPKKLPPQEDKEQLLESHDSFLDNSAISELGESISKDVNPTPTKRKKAGRSVRKDKVLQENKIEANDENKVSDDDDELDNVSLKTLSQRNGENIVNTPYIENTLAVKSENLQIAEYENLQPTGSENLQPTESEEIDVGENMILSSFGETSDMPNTEVQDMELDETVESHNSELNIDISNVKTEIFENGDKFNTNETLNDSLLMEDSSKRPTRRRTTKVMHYDEGSDEDPFANVELSDDEPGGRKRRYYSDDEYIPGSENKKGSRARKDITSDDDSDISDLDEDDYPKGKRRRLFSSNKNSRGNKSKIDDGDTKDINVTTITPKVDGDADDIEVCLQSSVIQANDNTAKNPTSVYTNEFENFIAKKIQGTNIQIKKVSSEQSSQNTPLEIPVLDPDARKTVEVSVQTNTVKKHSAGVQTNVQHEIPMKNNVTLTTEQANKACEFLKSIVKTTSELGQLMTEKSEDFITKKINTNHVTDTFKMDYCVKKSFLLLKLAKHNIVQMEEDLAKQYEEFLKQTNLISHRQEEKTIKPTVKDSDSDCEIVEVPQSTTPAKSNKAKFNPKTVFLNKELSIKIAKKPASKTVADKCKNTLNIKNKSSVWISDSVMVKKVKPTQSFLAQDSRNKKPPDNFVTEKMVSDFFDSYYKIMAPKICAPFTSMEWHVADRTYMCNYFFVKSDKTAANTTGGETHIESNNNNTSTGNTTDNSKSVTSIICRPTDPVSLITLCTAVLKKHMECVNWHALPNNDHQNGSHMSTECTNLSMQSPNSLFRLCLDVISGVNHSSSVMTSSLYNHTEEKQNQSSECMTVGLFDVENHKSPDTELEGSNTYIKGSEAMFASLDTEDPISKSNEELIDNKKEKDVSVTNITSQLFGPENLPFGGIKIVLPLQTLCFNKIKDLFYKSFEGRSNYPENDDTVSENSFLLSETGSYDLSVSNYEIDDMIAELDSVVKNNVKSLFSQCVEFFQKKQKVCVGNVPEVQGEVLSQKYIEHELFDTTSTTIEETPNSLKHLTFGVIKNMMYKNLNQHNNIYQISNTCTEIPVDIPVYKVKSLADLCFKVILFHTSDKSENYDQGEKTGGMTINCVNTLSEEAFHNMEGENSEEDESRNYYDDDNYDGSFNNFEDEQDEENNWEAQVQLQEFKPCIETNKQSDASQFVEQESCSIESENLPIQEPAIAQVKLEPADEPPEVDSTIVKAEPMQNDEMTIIPESIVMKEEHSDDVYDAREKVPLQRQNSSSFDMDTFEDFVRQNKMMHAIDESNDEVFTQSESKVRRQHKPDYMNEYDPSLNLLVPQMFEPLSVVNAKGVLMASSSDDENSGQKSNKKKADKKGRGRPKKAEPKQQNKDVISLKQTQDVTNAKSKQGKEPPSSKGKTPIPPPVNEVAVLTRRMREKIRQEEKKIESSDSEGENVPLSRKKEKDRKENTKSKCSKNKDEIQCSNVDSTEQIEQNDSTEDDKNFTGFSSVDQNEISSYQKYVKFVYDKILPKETEINEQATQAEESTSENIQNCVSAENIDDNRSDSPLINFDEPTEMLECEPTMPIFDDEVQEKKQRKRAKPKSKAAKEKEAETTENNITETAHKEKEPQVLKDNKTKYIEHNGWHCYPIDPNETKLYQNAAIILEKLPESFVETYFEYQEIADKQVEDKEVDRLINLNTLNRTSLKESQKQKGKRKDSRDGQHSKNMDTSRAATPNSDGCAELTASEDEGANVDDETPPPVPLKHTNENHLAKNSLMNESDSDEGSSKIKEESNDNTQIEGTKHTSKKKSKDRSVKESQVAVKSENPESLMLTADKMMNKELNLLHAPVVLDEAKEATEKGDKESSPKNKHKRGSRGHSSRDHMKNDDDSSSEEEKQWVSTKEKLLKRMGKKQDTTSADDAKRAKLVTEFIERREVAPGSRKRGGRGRGRGKRSNSRKVLEREKQMRVLSHELFGTPVDPALMGTRHQPQSYFKGRRNIRKVIDKKSLARSTVIANMEEFERKCRLNQRQAQLRELLGCEEGVNVLVINDEVCLEYGFEEQCPLVSVHPFFTKVMKAHQYEGVKFMWDACFETLEKVESGHPGGGCILAHCMGLGKTLQVLALLHTVLTHPRVGMQRILVCCPLSTVLNWVDEIHKWIGPVTDQIKARKLKRKLQVFELSKLKKTYERAYQLEDWYSGGGIFIIGYELFRSLTTLDPELDDVRPTIVNKIRTALLDPGPDIVVCDEGHLLKNDCSVLAVAMSRVATKRRIVLTGTPMQNNLREYYCMVNFVKPNLLGTYSEYSNRFENPIMNGQHRDSQEEDIKLMKQRTHILHKVLEGCLQRQEASVLYPYLPKKHEYTVFISPTKVQWELYKHYINNFSNTTKQSVLKDFHMLQKIWSHPLVLHNFQTKKRDELDTTIKPEKLEDDLAHEELTSEELSAAGGGGAAGAGAEGAWWLRYLDGGAKLETLDCSNKFLVVFKILDECIALGDKVLIFSTSLFTMDALEFFLKKINKWSLGQEYYRLDGSVPAEVRQKWCREFNAEQNLKTKLFLISTRAGSLGLNMVAANRVIILDTSWNPAHDIQSIFRVYRFGQKKDCYIYRLVALGTMEQKIYERSVTKQAVSCRVVDEQQIDRHYNMAELTELYKYDELGLSVSGGVAVGVTDVALLRVARLPALHAVHEHDSLLRGSSEQQLPEHERAAAWMQFQQEHAHKQMQNQLTSSFSLHLPSTQLLPTLPPHTQTYQQLVDGTGFTAPAVKTEPPNLLVPLPPKQPGKPGRKKKVVVNVPPELPPPSPDAQAIQENMSKKIMGILLRHNFQNRQGPGEIAKLVSTVRRIVAYGYVPKGSFDDSVAQQIADVLLMKEPPKQDPPSQRKRGRPRKEDQNSPTPSTSHPVFNYSHLSPGRRKAAINAEKQIDSFKESVTEVEDRGDDDWRDSDEEFVPESKTQKRNSPKTAPVTVKTEDGQASRVIESDSIVLSDDEPPPPPTAKTKGKKTIGPKKLEQVQEKVAEHPAASQEETIPLHPSLLSNKNFIKIVAHTYLEGNPMLDEDAATLAAQYSTLKAKKEFEATGKPIYSGPIYDIAIKILGIEILKKLHKANPNPDVQVTESKTSESGPSVKEVVKSEPVEEVRKPETVTKKPVAETKKPVAEARKPGPRLKAKGIKELMGRTSPVPTPAPAPILAPTPTPTPMLTISPLTPSVVPVGLINRSGGLAPAAGPAQPLAPPAREESILPDDDDVILPPDPPKNIFKKNAKPLILSSVLATTKFAPSPAPTQPKIPKLVISAGKLLPATGFVPQAVSTPQPASSSDTICLDSDEETITPNEPARKSKRVALKSTARPPAPPAPPAAPVPVRLTAANPLAHHQQPPYNPHHTAIQMTESQLSAMLGQPELVPQPQLTGSTITLGPSAAPMAGGKFYVLPAGHNLVGPHGLIPVSTQSQVYQNAYTVPQKAIPTPPLPQSTSLAYTPAPATAPAPTPTPAAPEPPPPPQSLASKTVCKPGDILRITKTGQIEVLNRDDDVTVVDDDAAPPTQPKPTQPKEPVRSRGRTAAAAPTPPPKPRPPSPQPSKSPPPEKTSTYDRSRSLSVSSSSSSDSSRASSPDPLSILKDVVHIKAPEDTPKPKLSNKPSMVGSTSIKPISTSSTSNSSTSKTNKNQPSKPSPKILNKEPVRTTSKLTATQDDIMKHISKTDTILKRLDKALGSGTSQTTVQRKPAILAKPKPPIMKTIDLIDLDSYEQPSSSKSVAKPSGSKPVAKPAPAKPGPAKPAPSKPAPAKPAPTKQGPTKIVGTSKDIIISVTGKSSTLTTANSGNKMARVTSVEKATVAKKRPAPSDAGPQKKKSAPMTLKDFNIDDIDDIIELE